MDIPAHRPAVARIDHSHDTARSKSQTRPTRSDRGERPWKRGPLTGMLRGVLLAGMTLLVVSTLTRTLGPGGADLVDLPAGIPGSSQASQLEAIGTLKEVPPIPKAGAEPTDAALAGPVTVGVEVTEATAAQRAANMATSVGAAVVWMSGLVLAYRLLGEVGERGPFTARTLRGMWLLAALAAIGGTTIGTIQEVVDASLIEGSDLADMFAVEYRLSLVPLIGGVAIALMALIVREGVTRISGIQERA